MNAVAQHPGVAAGMAQWDMPKPEGEIDLIKECRDMLVMSGLAAGLDKTYDENRHIQDGLNKGWTVQRFLLNRYWTSQLNMCQNTVDARSYLLHNGTPEAWLKLFQSAVLPVVMSNGLPKLLAFES